MGITVSEIYPDSHWAPYAYIGFIDGDEKNSFRLFVTKFKNYPDGLIAGFEYFQNGKLIKRGGLLRGISIGSTVHFSVSWDRSGTFIFSVLGGEEQTFHTSLRNVSQTLSVSGARVLFR